MNANDYKLQKSILILLFMAVVPFTKVTGQSKTDSITSFLQSEMIKRNIPGLQIAIIRNEDRKQLSWIRKIQMRLKSLKCC